MSAEKWVVLHCDHPGCDETLTVGNSSACMTRAKAWRWWCEKVDGRFVDLCARHAEVKR